MAGEPLVTVVGNATRDAEIRYSANGVGICTFTLATTSRIKKGDRWENGEPTYFTCKIWKDAAIPASDTIRRGMRLIVQGRLRTTSWTGRDGTQRNDLEINVEEVGPTLRYASADVTNIQRPDKRSNTLASEPSDDDHVPL
jgi:single-strand DNA-binding protein